MTSSARQLGRRFVRCLLLALATSVALAIVPQMSVMQMPPSGVEVDSAFAAGLFPSARSARTSARVHRRPLRTTYFVINRLSRAEFHDSVLDRFLFGVVSVGGFPLTWLYWTGTYPPEAAPNADSADIVRMPQPYAVDKSWLVGRRPFVIAHGVLWGRAVINLLLWTGAFMLVAVAFGRVRAGMRRRRGVCPRCRYPATGGPVCPECGEPACHRSPSSDFDVPARSAAIE